MGLGSTVCTHHSHLLTHWPDTWVLGVLRVQPQSHTHSLARYMGLGCTVCIHHSHSLIHWPDTWVLGGLCVHTSHLLTHWPDTWVLGLLCVHTTVTYSLTGLIHGSWVYCVYTPQSLTHWPDTWVLGVLCVHTTVTYSLTGLIHGAWEYCTYTPQSLTHSLARYMGLGCTVRTHHSHLLTHWPDTWGLGVLCVHTTVTHSLTGPIHGSWEYCVYTPQSLTHSLA